MSNAVRIALIASAPLELTLTAGLEELAPPAGEAPPDDAPFLNVGRHRGDELHLSGPLIGDPELPGASLTLQWYFPDEESEELARPVDMSEVRVFHQLVPRRRAEPGWRWRYRLESRRPFRQVHFFSAGFLPPFKPSDVSVRLEHLVNYNYDGHILTNLEWMGKPAALVESEWRFPAVESEGCLED